MIITRGGRSGAGVTRSLGRRRQGGETETMADARTRREVFLLFFFGFFNVKITFQLFLPCVRFYQILI
jgi:hypothetical protein